MGAGVSSSLPTTVDRNLAQRLAGENFDANAFDNAAAEDGTVSRAAFLRAASVAQAKQFRARMASVSRQLRTSTSCELVENGAEPLVHAVAPAITLLDLDDNSLALIAEFMSTNDRLNFLRVSRALRDSMSIMEIQLAKPEDLRSRAERLDQIPRARRATPRNIDIWLKKQHRGENPFLLRSIRIRLENPAGCATPFDWDTVEAPWSEEDDDELRAALPDFDYDDLSPDLAINLQARMPWRELAHVEARLLKLREAAALASALRGCAAMGLQRLVLHAGTTERKPLGEDGPSHLSAPESGWEGALEVKWLPHDALGGLCVLQLQGTVVHDLGALGALSALAELELDGCVLLPTEATAAANVRHAVGGLNMRWRQNLPPTTLDGLERLPHLEKLTVHHLQHATPLGTVACDVLAGCTQLRELIVRGHTLSSLTSLRALPNLITLELELSSRNDMVSADPMTGSMTDLSPFSAATKLTRLCLVDPARLSDTRPVTDLASLSHCTQLTYLDLSGIRIASGARSRGVEDLFASGCWPSLSSLILRGTPIKRVWRLADSPTASSLTHLDLSGNRQSLFGALRPGILELPAAMPGLSTLVAEYVAPRRWFVTRLAPLSVTAMGRDEYVDARSGMSVLRDHLTVYETMLPLQHRLPARCRLTLEKEVNMSVAMLWDRTEARSMPRVAWPDADAGNEQWPIRQGGKRMGEAPPLLPGRSRLLSVEDSDAGAAERHELRWLVRVVDDNQVSYDRLAPTSDEVLSTQRERPWVVEPPVAPIGQWWRIRCQSHVASEEFETYAPDQSELRVQLLDVCRAGLAEDFVNHMHADDGRGDDYEWRGLPDWHRCPLPTAADGYPLAVDTVALAELLDAGTFPDCSDMYGRTPVFYACLLRDAAALHLLLRAGANASYAPWDRACLPPLFWACYFEAPECMLLLAHFGATPFCEGAAGEHYRLVVDQVGIGQGCHSLESFRAALGTNATTEAVAEVMRVCGPAVEDP